MKTVSFITALFTAVLLSVPLFSYAQSPLIIVNDRTTELTDLKQIAPQDIESITTEPVDEESIERYGPRANNGIIRVTLKYDEPALYTGPGESFDRYVASRTNWPQHEAAARVAVRYTIGEDGRLTFGEVLEATDKRLKHRVMKAAAEAVSTPMWIPARRKGVPVATERVLQIQLPEGKSMPREPYIIIL